MKKFFLLLLLIPLFSSAQGNRFTALFKQADESIGISHCVGMQRTEYVGEPFNYITYTVPCNSTWVIIQPGNGAASYDMATLGNIGYGKLAQSTTLPFNLLIVQAKKGKSWLDDYVPVKINWTSTFQKLGISRAILTGYSLGGKETIRQLWTDHSGVFIGFVAMCGDYPYGPEVELKSNVVNSYPMFLLAGDNDKEVSWWQSNTVNNMVNRVHPGQSVMVIIPGGSHSDGWLRGYNRNDEYGKHVWNFIVDRCQLSVLGQSNQLR